MAAPLKDVVQMFDTDKHRIRKRRAFSQLTQGFHVEDKPRHEDTARGKNIKLAVEVLRKYRRES